MPNELSYKDYPNGDKAYFRDDTAREQIINNRVKVTGSAPIELTFTNGTADFNISDIAGATWIIGVLGWGARDAYCISLKNFANGIYTIHNVKNPTFTGKGYVVFVYITY